MSTETDPIDTTAVAEDEATRYSEDLISRAEKGDLKAIRDLIVILERERRFPGLPDGAFEDDVTAELTSWAEDAIVKFHQLDPDMVKYVIGLLAPDKRGPEGDRE